MALVDPSPFYLPKMGTLKQQNQHSVQNLIGRGGELFEVYSGSDPQGLSFFALKHIKYANLDKAALAYKDPQNMLPSLTSVAKMMLTNEFNMLKYLNSQLEGYSTPKQPGYLDLNLFGPGSQVIDYDVAGGCYLPTILKAGQTLAQYISKPETTDKLGPDRMEKEPVRTEVLRIIQALVGGVVYLHSIGISHLNITPDNVIFTKGKLALCGYTRAKSLQFDHDGQNQKRDIKMLAECIYSLITGFHPDNMKMYNQGYMKRALGSLGDPLLDGYCSKHLGPLYSLKKPFEGLYKFLCDCFDGNFNSAVDMQTAFRKVRQFQDSEVSLPLSTQVPEPPSCLALKGLFPRLQGVSFANFHSLMKKVTTSIDFVVDEYITRRPLLAGITIDPRINSEDMRNQRQKIWRKLILLVIMSLGQANYLVMNTLEALQKQFRLSFWVNSPETNKIPDLIREYQDYSNKFEQRIQFFWQTHLSVNQNSQFPCKHAMSPVGNANYDNFRKFYKTAFTGVFLEADHLSMQMMRYPDAQIAIMMVVNLGAAMFQISEAVNLHKQDSIDYYFERFGILTDKNSYPEEDRIINVSKGLAAAKLLYTRVLRNLD